jgi:FkbM family methyltransferase
MEFEAYGINFIFNEENNEKIHAFPWLVDVLKSQKWEPFTFSVFDKFKDNEKIAIDIGGWIGPTTIFLSKRFKEVIVIEADNVAFESLVKNLKDNCCENIILHNKAFFNSKNDKVFFGVNSFKVQPTFGSSTSQTKTVSDNNADYLIDTINIFNIIENTNPNNIGLIKVDIEGGDEDVFEELISVESNYGWKIWISFHYGWWKDKNVRRFEHLIKLIKKVSRDDMEIPKDELLSLIELNVPESFLIEL